MKAAGSRVQPAMPDESAIAAPSWLDHVSGLIRADWRPSEWRSNTWLFVGDAKNPQTRIFDCVTPGCELRTEIRKNGRCTSCMKFLREHQGDAQQLETYSAGLNGTRAKNGQPKTNCRVETGGRRCERDAWTSGLCSSHAIQWRSGYKGRGMTVDDFIESKTPRPYAALSDCIVSGCGRQRSSMTTELCTAHRTRFGNRLDKARTERDFADRAGPILMRGSFSLLPLPEPLRSELLVALQEEDRAGYGVDPILVAVLAQQLGQVGESFLEPAFVDRAIRAFPKSQRRLLFLIRRVAASVQVQFALFTDVDPTAGDVWDTYVIGLQTADHRRGKANSGNTLKFSTKRNPIDFTPIRQVWLRELVKHWGRDLRPTTSELADAVKAFTIMSEALSLRRKSEDPTTASIRDIQKTIELINSRDKPDGERYSGVTRSKLLTAIRQTLNYLRGAGLMDAIPPGFALLANDRVDRARPADEKPGRALPYRVVMALSQAIPSLPENAPQSGALISGREATLMYRAALRVLIDTGRRPNEVCSLKVGCVTKSIPPQSDEMVVEYTLTYDNHKAGRDGRTLAVTRETGEAILEWQQFREALTLPSRFDGWLFPSPSAGRKDADKHLTTTSLNRAVTRLVETVSRLEDDVPDPKSGGYLLFRGKIEPYSFRHSYAQRHADAGVDPDTLRELMDHRSISTTMGYYTISAKRKRAAIDKLSSMSVDWHGVRAPMVSASSYEVGSVAVPWGNCTDPSNVKAGGHACPIRFRCSGCSMYRPDPSFLPGIQEHVTQLRATIAMVEMAGTAAPWVLQSMREEIAGYDEIMRAMRKQIAALPAEEQEAVSDASAALRKVRAQRPMIPLTIVRRTNA